MGGSHPLEAMEFEAARPPDPSLSLGMTRGPGSRALFSYCFSAADRSNRAAASSSFASPNGAAVKDSAA